MSKWHTSLLGEIADLNPRLVETLQGDTPVSFVPMSAVTAATASTSTGETRSYSDVSKGYTPFLNGDVLLAKITPCFENGKIAQATLSHQFGFGSTEFHVVRPLAGKADARYLLHYLRQERIRRDGARKMTGSAGQRRVPEHFLAGLEVPLPPLAEQRRIADVLDRAESLRAKRRDALAKLDTLPQAIFNDMFGNPATNPKKWSHRPLTEFVRHDDTINYGVVQPGEDFDGGVPLVRVSDLVDGRICHDFLKRIAPGIEAAYKRSRLKGDEILLVCVGATAGVVALADESGAKFNIARAIARIPLSQAMDRVFVAAYLQTEWVQQYFTSELRTVAQPTLNIKQICELPVIHPPLELQQHFARRIASVEQLRSAHRASLVQLDALFACLQHRAFQGVL